MDNAHSADDSQAWHPTDLARALFVITGMIAQVVMGALPFIQGWAVTVADRSAEQQVLITPASYAFSIWSVLFVGCALYSLIHLIRMAHPTLRATGWFAGAAFWLNAAWESWVPFFGIEGVSLLLIGASWLCCVAFMWIGSADARVGLFGRATRLPIYALGGWLNAAAFVNLLITAEYYDLPWLGSGEVAPALAVLAAATLAAFIIVVRTGSITYAAALAWGLFAISVTSQDEAELVWITSTTEIGIAALLVAVLISWVGRGLRARRLVS